MASWKYKIASTNDLVQEFKTKAASFNRSVRGLEDKAKKCESLKWLGTESSIEVLKKGDDDKYFLDWQPYLNDGKRKLSRSVVKLKEIQNHRKQRKVSLISSLRETLPSWAKKQSPWKSIQLHQLISDTEDYETLISDIVQQINSADELSKLVNKISNQRDPNQNEQISKELQDLTKRWNTLNLTVINRSNNLETLSLEVDREYKKLNQWYKKSDSFRLWLDSTEKASNEDSGGPEDSLPSNMEKLTAVEHKIKEHQSRKPQLQEINSEADQLLGSGRLDQGDTERVHKMNETLSSRYTALEGKQEETKSKLSGDIQLMKEKPEEKTDTQIVEASVEPDEKPPRTLITPFLKDKDESSKRDLQRSDSLKAVKKMLKQTSTKKVSDGEKNRIDDEPVKAFDSSLDACEQALDEIDNESMEKFSFVGSTINEIKEQLDDIQELEQNMAQEDMKFADLKQTFEEGESKDLIKEGNSKRLREKIDDLNSRLEEMWRTHDTNKNRLVQAILIMGTEWMDRVNNSLDELEKDMESNEIPEGDLEKLRGVKQRHEEIMNNIISREDSVSGAVDVGREVHRRDLVTEETGKTIENETQALEDRLERLIGKAEERKKRISEELNKAEEADMIAETMEASSVMSVNTAPEAFQSDEGFLEPKQGLSDEKESYENLIKRKMKELKKESKYMNEWMDETERLVNALRVDMDPRKATRIQNKINTYYAQVDEKQATVDHIVRLSKEIGNETIDPNVSGPFLKVAETVNERWNKNKEMLENHGDNDAASKAEESSCCVFFLNRKFIPALSYN
ncbi:putative leucine-rich repeat-containing protein DDB_G0290503 [Montipora capricornis]|uniref:putative leucine-rich repeat-containing protein DDB_G0290503 n=1 Tax=Montipora capricornis TaxID=246305 RepID=UPI0035F17B1F